LARRITPRQASACRGLIETYLRVQDYEEVEKQLVELEARQAATEAQIERMGGRQKEQQFDAN
jgi:cell division protein FtsB